MINVEPRTKTIKRRKLKRAGHLMRLLDDAPAKLSLKEYLGRPKTTWLKTIMT